MNACCKKISTLIIAIYFTLTHIYGLSNSVFYIFYKNNELYASIFRWKTVEVLFLA